jgi:SAM-dependent methyltransferase
LVTNALAQPFAAGSFDIALVLESMASIADPAALLREVGRVLNPGGRLACTVEAGPPLAPSDLTNSADNLQAHVRPAGAFLGLLRAAGFHPLLVDDHTPQHAGVAGRLAEILIRERAALVEELGVGAVEDLVATVSTWAELLARGRVAKLAIVARRLA